MNFRHLLALTLLISSACIAAPAENLPLVNWPAEGGLDATISLESAHSKVSDVVVAVGAQTKVRLNLPTQLLERSLVIRADKMPLSQLLPALAQLYGLEWTRDQTPASFSARLSATPTELAYLQLGDLNELRDRVRLSAQQSEGETLQLAKGWDETRLTKGIALSELPQSLGEALQSAKRQRVALNYLGDWGANAPFSLRQMRVRVSLPRAGGVAGSMAPHFQLIDASGTPRRDLGAMERGKE